MDSPLCSNDCVMRFARCSSRGVMVHVNGRGASSRPGCTENKKVTDNQGERAHPCIRIYIPVPCPRFIFGEVEGPEKIHCVEHLRETTLSYPQAEILATYDSPHSHRFTGTNTLNK